MLQMEIFVGFGYFWTFYASEFALIYYPLIDEYLRITEINALEEET